MPVELKRGVNIEGWLGRPPEKNPLRFEREDAELVARLGFDHIRINVDHKHLWDEAGEPIKRTFDKVDAMLDTCSRLGLKAIFDLHRCPFFRERSGEVHFHEPETMPRFLKAWRALSDHLRDRPNDMLVYEFFNEPTAKDPEDWNRLADAVHVMLRELEPGRTFILGSNAWGGPGSFPQLRPREDRNLILTFHFYLPFHLTHYRVAQHNGKYQGPVHYPGQTITDEDLATMSEEQRESTLKDNGPYNPTHLREKMSPAIDVARKLDMPLYCGEWGCYDTVPRPDRLRWYADMIAVLEEENIGWCAYAYRNRWGVVLDKDGKLDEELVGIVLSGSSPAKG